MMPCRTGGDIGTSSASSEARAGGLMMVMNVSTSILVLRPRSIYGLRASVIREHVVLSKLKRDSQPLGERRLWSEVVLSVTCPELAR